MGKRDSARTTAWTASTYLGEGLPWSFLHQMGTEYLTAIGSTKPQIASTSALHLAVSLKFLWSPVVDLFGRKRTWVWVTQLVLGGAMLVVAAATGVIGYRGFMALLAGLAILHATHDIACDGFYMAALDRKDQALYSGVRVAAFRVAMILGSSGFVYLAGRTSWLVGFGAAGVAMLIVSGINSRLMPRAQETRPPQELERHKLAEFRAAFRSFLAQPQAVLVLSFMLFYKLGDIMMFAMSKPLLNDIGIDLAHRGILNGIGTVVNIGGSMLGGALIARHGLERCLIPMTYFQNFAIPLYVVMAVTRPGFAGVISIVAVEQLAAGVGSAAHVVFLMRRCRAAFSASHYAFATAVVSVGSTFSGYFSGDLNQWLGHPKFFGLAFVVSIPSLILVLVVPRAAIDN